MTRQQRRQRARRLDYAGYALATIAATIVYAAILITATT